jgi:NAD(P)-dependent dehydrogenase (short-subunit alcohol dehydrogenase family)
MAELDGKTALVTGAARGIGRATALRLAADGARVAVHYGTSADTAHEVVNLIRARGGEAFALQAQLGIPGDAAALWAAFDNEVDGVDIIVNNAGTLGARQPFQDVTEAGLEHVFAINTRAPFFIVQHGLERVRDGGRIVNVSTSLTRGRRNPDLIAYSMSKAAIDAFTAALAKHLGPRGITVNAVEPGATATDMNAARLATPEGREAIASRSPLGRVAEPEDIADVIAFLASADARWVTGQSLDVTGGALL